jgi:hypothetical protein
MCRDRCLRVWEQIAPELFGDKDKYTLFAKKVWPVLAQCREQLGECYQADNGRPGVEPVMLLGVLIFQFLERVPDRQALELVKFHLGWKLALNLKLSEGGFHPTTLVYFRSQKRSKNMLPGWCAILTIPMPNGQPNAKAKEKKSWTAFVVEARVNRRSHWLTRIANRSKAKPGLVNAPTQA